MPRKPWQLAEWQRRRKLKLEQLATLGKDVCASCGSRDALVFHHPSEPHTLSDEEYFSLEGAILLCRRCHLAHHKGMVLCRECKKRYHKRQYPMCWSCFKKTPQGRKIAEQRERKPYVHPWCGKVFMVEKRWWNIEAEPQMCCIERCDRDANSCDVALRRWGEKPENAP